ncbi:MAG: hypothetical protein M1827_001113 [Pycnora praestabilis]|nr:MAG: hypothetical protein M1827_001113 [Pycnora praestabilis]
MVKVALAGATSGFGQNIRKAILDLHKHEIVLLSRTEQPELSAQGIDVYAVDYTNHTALVNALRGVHTVISAIAALDDSFRTSQLALLSAAKEAGVKRFAPSEFAHATYEGIDLYQPKAMVWDAVRKSGLEYTKFTCGLFMNGLATGTPRGEKEALAGLRPWNFVFNVRAGTADLPGDGTAKVTLISMQDVGRFVAAALDLEYWDEESGMVGETLSCNGILALLERVTKRKFLVKYNSVAEMEHLARVEGGAFYNQVRIAIAKGQFDVSPKLNKRIRSVEPRKTEDFLVEYWEGVKLGEPVWGTDHIAV